LIRDVAHDPDSARQKLSVGGGIVVHMFDRCPDAQLVTDLVAVQEAAPVLDPDAAAVDLLEQAVAWDRVAAWVEANRLDTLRRFEAARIDADTALGEEDEAVMAERSPAQRGALLRMRANLAAEAGKFAAEEIALALNVSPTSAHKQLTLARDLHAVHLDLGEALELGQVSGFVASMVAAATRRLPDEARRVIDEAVTADAVEQPAGKAIAAARARVSEADEYAELMIQRAVQDRRVFLKPMDDGVAMLGAVLPAEDALRAWNRIDELARTCRAAGDPANLDQLRADLVAQTLTGADLDTQPDPAGQRARTRKPVSVQVVISLTSLLGLDSRNGFLDGYGTITPGVARRIIAAGEITLTRLLCDPVTGSVMVADPAKYRPDTATRHAVVCRDRHCRLPVCTARIRDLDHKQAFADGGLTRPDTLQGLCERSHLARSHPGWKITGNADTALTWHTPTGHRYHSLPPPATGYGTGPPGELDNPLHLPSWLSQQQRLRAELDNPRDEDAA